MYRVISFISLCIRIYLCYLTIDTLPIFENGVLNSIFLEAFSLYTFLMIISRGIVGRFYNKGDFPTLGAICYFFVYIVCLGVLYGTMLALTKFGILPIVL